MHERARGHCEGLCGGRGWAVGAHLGPGSLAGVSGVWPHEVGAGGWGRRAAGARARAAVPSASISPSPAPDWQAPPRASRLLPQAAALAGAVRCGAGLCVAAAAPPSVPTETWTPREPSSRRSAPSKVRAGAGARARGRGPGSDLQLRAAPRRAAVKVCCPWSSLGDGELGPQEPPGPCTARAPAGRGPPGVGRGLLLPQPCGPAASVGGRGGLLQRRRRVGGELWLGLRVRPFASRTLRSPRPAAALQAQRPRGQARAVGITAGRRQAGWPRASPHCGSLFRGGGAGGCRRAPTGCPGNLEGPECEGRRPPCLPALALPAPNQPLRLRFCRVGAGQKGGILPALGLCGGRPHPGAERGERGGGGVRCGGAAEAAANILLQAPTCCSPRPLGAPGLLGGRGIPYHAPPPFCGAPRGCHLVQARVGGETLGPSAWEALGWLGVIMGGGGMGWLGGRLGDLGG